ncbi:hypothetical protein ACN47E_004734 [Coniothyrium glycines]
MAIIEGLKGVKVEIVVAGQALKEFDDDEDDQTRNSNASVTKYIEAESDAEFSIRTTFSKSFSTKFGVGITINVDGTRLTYNYESSDLHSRKGLSHYGTHHRDKGIWYQRNYRFAAINIVEETNQPASMAQLQKKLQDTGIIEVTFHYFTNARRVTCSEDVRDTNALIPMGSVPEKALKGDARSHQAVLGVGFPLQMNNSHVFGDLVNKNAFATFRFKYRSLAALKALRIVVEDTDPIAPLEDRPEEELTHVEPQEVVRRMRRHTDIKTPLKQEKTQTVRVKRERRDGSEGGTDDDVTFVETRTVKRLRVEGEPIVLD